MSQASGVRRQQLLEARQPLLSFNANEFFELPGRPNVIYTIGDYSKLEGGIDIARREVPFLFKAFETGQMRPPRPGTKAAEEPRASTIHEYLDWTVTAAAGGEAEDDLDFGGFRTVLLIPRFRPSWPPPNTFTEEAPKKTAQLGAPRCPLPILLPKSKPVSAATIRCGPDFLEVPFFATHDSHRNQGFGRALLEALEDIARACRLPRMLLCSTDDPLTRNTWRHLGFVFTQAADLHSFGVQHGDLMHMDNTVQMHKTVPPARPWKSLVIRHDQWAQRVYYPPATDAVTGPLLEQPARQPSATPPTKKKTKHSKHPFRHGSIIAAEAQPDGAAGGMPGDGDATLAGQADAEPAGETDAHARAFHEAEATELTEATELSIGEAHAHPLSAWQAPVGRSARQWQPEGLEVTGPAQRWRGFGEPAKHSIAVALPH